MKSIEIIFWFSVSCVFYAYIGYALLLQLFTVKRKLQTKLYPQLPITIVVPVYNEEKFIRKKIENCFSLNYDGPLKFLFVNDGSADNTLNILREFKTIELVNMDKRRGKTAALNKAMQMVQTPIVVFTDANALLNKNCLQHLVKHFADSSVGGVSGEKIIAVADKIQTVSTAEQLYWQYESFLKKADADFYSIVGADGGLYAMRSELFIPVEDHIILDDFFITMQVCGQGYRFAYEPKACAIETSSTSIIEEQKRKIRISAGCFQALFNLRGFLNPFKNFRLFIIYFSHRVMRWIGCPLLLPLIFLSNIYLLNAGQIYHFLFVFQLIFYGMAAAAWLYAPLRKLKIFTLPFYFIFMNASLYQGFIRYLKNRQSVMWAKTERMEF